MHDRVLIDGAASDTGWTSERAFQYGDGLFETVAFIDGRPCLWDAHMARLVEGCRRLRLPTPDAAVLAEECRALADGLPHAVIKIYWTAGESRRGYARPTPLAPRRVLRLSEWPNTYAGSAAPWALRLCEQRLGENAALAGIKHLNRLEQVLARSEWSDPAIDEGVMLGQDGRVLCGTMSNLFVQQGDALITPCLQGAGIAGVVRALLLRLAGQRQMDVRVGHVSEQQLAHADAVYLTNSLVGVKRVARFETTRYDMQVDEYPLIDEARSLCHEPEVVR